LLSISSDVLLAFDFIWIALEFIWTIFWTISRKDEGKLEEKEESWRSKKSWKRLGQKNSWKIL